MDGRTAILGYARVSTAGQDLDAPLVELTAAAYTELRATQTGFDETVSNRQKNAWRNLTNDGGAMADPPSS